MLTLEKDATSTPVIGIYHKDQAKLPKRPVHTVHFTHNVDPETQNVAPAEGVLELHRDFLKKKNHVNDADFDLICKMIDQESEPHSSHPLRGQYWDIKDHFDRYLKREMYLGDTPDMHFQLNPFGKKKEDWPGSMTLFANSGGGKTYHIVSMIERYLKTTPDWQKKPILYVSPEVEIDRTLKPLKDKRWEMWFHGIDVSPDALKKSGKDSTSFFETEISEKLETMGENAIVVFDDYADAAPALVPMLTAKYNSMLRVARHRNIGVIQLAHTYSGGRKTSQSLQSNRYITFFPRSQQARTIRFLTDHLQLGVPEAKALVRRFAALDRYMTVSMFSPVCVFNSKYLHLL